MLTVFSSVYLLNSISENILLLLLIIIIKLFIEGSLTSANALFCLRALFGATRIHSYTRMASLIRTRLSDLYTRREVCNFGEETFGYKCTPGCKPSYLCPVGPRNTDVPNPRASTLISAPWSKQLGHQGYYYKREHVSF